MSVTNPDDVVTKGVLADFYQEILPYLGGGVGSNDGVIYGFRIEDGESAPSAKVTYLADATWMTPAHMNYTTGKFDYGSWENAFFMPRPCMLKYDGTVDYYLDPNDYTKKEDGVTASDVGNTSYAGNAMMEWGQNGKKIWLKIEPDLSNNNSANIFIANYKADPLFTDWPFHNSNGDSVDHFYTAIYNGSLISDKLRSISGQSIVNKKTAQQELDYAYANNPTGSLIWFTESISEIDLINALLILISKSTDSQTSFGKGLSVNGSETEFNTFRTGVHNTKGLFYGTNSGTASVNTNAVKVFGMENWWGLIWNRYLGELCVGGYIKRKLTYGQEDGSTVTGYNFTGNGYSDCGTSQTIVQKSSYIDKMIYSNFGIIPIPQESGGSGSTNYCDKVYYDNNTASTVTVARRGGRNTEDTTPGQFAVSFEFLPEGSGWAISAKLSAKPLS